MKNKKKNEDFLLALGGIICFAAGFILLMALDEKKERPKKKEKPPTKDELTALMQTYSQLQEFEKAAAIKKQIESIPDEK